jgi:branched-chain amino acid transport system substrate-binding protein
MKKGYLLLTLLLAAVLVVSCAPAPTGEEPTEEMAETEEMVEAVAPDECAEENACAVYAPGEPIRIGVAGPLTGDNSAYGQDIVNAAFLAAAAHGEFEGHAYEIAPEDDLGTPDGGAAAANKFASDPTIAGVIGHAFSGATGAGIPIYTDAQIPMFSPSATNPALTQDGNVVFNRGVGTDALQGLQDAEFIYNVLGARTLAVTHDSTTYGQGLAEVVRDEFTNLGGEVVAFEAITPGESDYSAVLSTLAALEPEAVFHGGYVSEFHVLVSQRAAAGFTDTPFLSGDGVFGQTYFDLAGDATLGTYVSSPVPGDSPEKLAFDDAYLAAYGVGAGVLSAYSYQSWDVTNAMMQVLESVAIVGSDGTVYVPRAAFVDAMRHLSGYIGLAGEYTCDEAGECAVGGFTVFGVETVDGELTWVAQ